MYSYLPVFVQVYLAGTSYASYSLFLKPVSVGGCRPFGGPRAQTHAVSASTPRLVVNEVSMDGVRVCVCLLHVVFVCVRVGVVSGWHV